MSKQIFQSQFFVDDANGKTFEFSMSRDNGATVHYIVPQTAMSEKVKVGDVIEITVSKL